MDAVKERENLLLQQSWSKNSGNTFMESSGNLPDRDTRWRDQHDGHEFQADREERTLTGCVRQALTEITVFFPPDSGRW